MLDVFIPLKKHALLLEHVSPEAYRLSPHLTLSCSIISEQLAALKGIDFDMPSTRSWMLSLSF